MRATSIAYIDSTACLKHLFSSVAATVLEKTIATLANVRNVSSVVTVVTSSKLYDQLNKCLLQRIIPEHKLVLDVVPEKATFFEACGAIHAHLQLTNYMIWRPVTPFVSCNVIENCVHNVLAKKGNVAIPVREFEGFSSFPSGAVRLTSSGYWTQSFMAFNDGFDFSEDSFCKQLTNKDTRIIVSMLETLDVTKEKELPIIEALADNLIGSDF